MHDQDDGGSSLPPALTSRAAFLMQIMTTRVQEAGEIALRDLGISGREYGVLAVLEGGRTTTQRRLGVILGIDRTTAMTLITTLQSRGLIRRARDPNDRRVYLVNSTAEGERIRERAAAVLLECENRFLSSLDHDERARLLSMLQRLTGSNRRHPGIMDE